MLLWLREGAVQVWSQDHSFFMKLQAAAMEPLYSVFGSAERSVQLSPASMAPKIGNKIADSSGPEE